MSGLLFIFNPVTKCHDLSCSIPSFYVSTQLGKVLRINSISFFSLSIYNWNPCAPSVLIIRWWIPNPIAYGKGSLYSLSKVIFTTISSPFNYSSVSVSVFPPPPPICMFCLLGRRPHPLQIQTLLFLPSCCHPWIKGLRFASRHRSIFFLVKIYCVTVFWQQEK